MKYKNGVLQDVVIGLDTAAPAIKTPESVFDHLEQTIGTTISKVITLNVSNGTQSLNCFQLTGTVEVLRLYGEITTTSTFTNCTNVFFEIYDSTATRDITKSGAGAVLSGMAVGTFIVKDAALGTALAVANNSTGMITEGSTAKIFEQFFLTQKTAADTYIRFTYTSSDAPVAATITVYCDYIGLGGGTLVVA